ncbi:MAG: helix-turn-helix domain-containing protein [Verrucomicrobiota bacterium]
MNLIPDIAYIRLQFKRRRKALGLTQEKFAREAGIGFGNYKSIESGAHTNPTIGLLDKIEQTLNALEQMQQEQEQDAAKPAA